MTAQWVIADHSMARIGDLVQLAEPAGVEGEIVGVERQMGLPEVRFTCGPKAGETAVVWPGVIARITKKK